MAWTTFLPILVFLLGFVLDLDASRDLETMTFDLGGHGAWVFVCAPSLKFVGLLSPKI